MSAANSTVITGKDPIPFVAAAVAAQVIGCLVTQLSPLIIGGVIAGLELTERQAGNLAFAEFLLLSIAAIAVAPVLPRIPVRQLCLWAAGATILADLFTVFAVDIIVVTLLRCIAGVGAGIIYAASLAVVASHSKNPERVYGLFQVTWAGASILLFSAGGHFTELYAQRGIFGLITLVTLLLAPLLRWLPATGTRPIETVNPATAVSGPVSMGLTTLAGVFVYLVATAAVYTFTEPLGRRAGLDAGDVGNLLTVGAILGLAGAGMATWLNVRRGRGLPVTVFCAAYALLAIAICLNTDPVVFGICLILTIIFFYFSVPYLFGIAAALDSQGRWAAAAGSAYLLGFAVGPAVSGAMIDRSGYPALGFITAVMTFAAWAMLMMVVRFLSNRNAPAAGES